MATVRVNVDIRSRNGGAIEIDGTTLYTYPTGHNVDRGASVSLEAVPADGYYFTNWSGDLASSDNPVTMVMDEDKAVVANFSRIMHTLTIKADGNGSTTPSVNRHGYGLGMVVEVSATPDSGWQFESWSGDVADPESATTTIKMDSDRVITANFSQIVHPVTITVNGGGSTNPMAGTHNFGEGTVVEITATPDSGWRFENWSGDIADPESATTKVSIDSEKAVAANFIRTVPSGWVIGAIIGGVAAAITLRLVTRRHKASLKRKESDN